MVKGKASTRRQSNAYNIFILILTMISLVIMFAMFLPLTDETIGLLQAYDNLICVFFLIDFLVSLITASHKMNFFIKERGWLDLLGSIPSLGLGFKYLGLLRLARLNRATRIAIQLRGKHRGELFRDILENRSQYASFLTMLLAIIILAFASVLVLQFESASPDAKILTGWDAFWYSFVTITTVGYGDFYPVTTWGRVTGMFIMLAGVGIIGALASLMSSLLIGESHESAESDTTNLQSESVIHNELAAIRQELAALRQLVEKNSISDNEK